MKMIEYKLQVNGLFGRNRKVKFDSFTLSEVAVDSPLNEASLKELAALKITEIKLKSGRLKIMAYPITVENIGGVEMKTTTISLAGNDLVLDLGTFSREE